MTPDLDKAVTQSLAADLAIKFLQARTRKTDRRAAAEQELAEEFIEKNLEDLIQGEPFYSDALNLVRLAVSGSQEQLLVAAADFAARVRGYAEEQTADKVSGRAAQMEEDAKAEAEELMYAERV